MIKADYSASLLQSSMSHDPSEIIRNFNKISQYYCFFQQAKETPLKNITNLTDPKLLSGNVYTHIYKTFTFKISIYKKSKQISFKKKNEMYEWM